MFRKTAIAATLLSLCVVGSGASFAFAMSGSLVATDEHHHEKASSSTSTTEVCPVSGEAINGDTKITYEYKGKTYRFCCPDCAEEFKKNPEKYIDKIKKQDGKKS